MFISIEPSNGVPMYEQIVRQVKFSVASRTLRPGQMLPSVRDLATQLAVNPNTVSRAMGQLQSDGVVESLRGRGMVVCQGAPAQCRRERQAIVAQRIQAVLDEAAQAGLGRGEIETLVDKSLRALPDVGLQQSPP